MDTADFLGPRLRLWGLCTAGGAVACTATLLGFAGRWHWLADLFSHFRVQYFLGLAVLALALTTMRRRRTAGVLAVFAAINLCTIAPLYLPAPSNGPQDGTRLRAMLLNVNTYSGDPALVERAIAAEDPDLLVLEEISDDWAHSLDRLSSVYPHSQIHTRDDNFGIGLFSKLPILASDVVAIGSAGVPSIVAEVDAGAAPLTILATHPLPPAGAAYARRRDDQLARLPDHIPASRAVVLADLNATPWSWHFRRLLRRSGLRDSSRGHGVQPSWPAYNPLLRVPLDHCLHTPDVTVLDRRIGPYAGSDHYPLIVDLLVR